MSSSRSGTTSWGLNDLEEVCFRGGTGQCKGFQIGLNVTCFKGQKGGQCGWSIGNVAGHMAGEEGRESLWAS